MSALLSKTTAVLLGLIAQSPCNAYELTKRLTRLRVSDWYDIPASTVYAAIRTAEKKGYVEGRVEKEGKMPDKTVYTLTASGWDALLETLSSFLSQVDYDTVPFTIAVFFLGSLPKEQALQMLQDRLLLLKKHKEGITLQIGRMEQARDIPGIATANVHASLLLVEAMCSGTQLLLEELKKPLL